MDGTFAGNLAGSAYYLYFQLAGIILAFSLPGREKRSARLLTGSVLGSLLLTWLPVLCAFFLDFTLQAHILALCLTLPAVLYALQRHALQRHALRRILRQSPASGFLKSPGAAGRAAFPVAFVLVMGLWIFLLYTHTLLPDVDGALTTGQCTYGDMNMHLGFITSLARQHTFPPDYSILPGVRLSYPFLSDSVSSCLLLFGASLRYAYALPMVFAMGQVLASVYLLAQTVLSSPGRTSHSAALLVFVLFFLNGGLGFLYFTGLGSAGYNFSDIFTGFYTTPTNLVEQNIRWVNVIADMLLPQRATLFGYSVIFPFLWLLYRAAFRNRPDLFPLAGLLGGALPMIHTHSFLSACVIGGSWLLLWLYREPALCPKIPGKPRPFPLKHPGGWILAVFLILMCLIQQGQKNGKISSAGLMAMGAGLYAGVFLLGLTVLARYVKAGGLKKLLSGWGVWLLLLLLPALPQLLFWTFGQVARGGFVRGHFNWGNQGEPYLWFYLKNMGIPLLLLPGAARTCRRPRAPLLLPALLLWWIGELVVFTPNTYDNNKLLYPAYLLLCLGIVDYGLEKYRKLRGTGKGRGLWALSGIAAGSFLLFSVLSGVLTLGREAVSRYRLYSPSQVALAQYIEAHTAPEAVFLTGTRHNNEVASLTGRTVPCGSDTFLYFHGLDTTERKEHLRLMYEAPLEHLELYEKYRISYVVVSSFERSAYSVAEEDLDAAFQTVFSLEDVKLYRVP